MYTIKPSEKYAKVYGRNLRISNKDAIKLCRVIRKKPLDRAKRLLIDLASEKRSLAGKHYTKTAREMVSLLNLKMNALYQKYYNGDELTPRQKIEKEIAETYQQLLEAQKEADKVKAELEKARLISKKKK